MAKSIYDFSVETTDGKSVPLEQYRGKTLLIVNTASKCGFTPQYEDLETLYKELQPQGLEILGFPCNQFGGQEPGDNQEIQSFCQVNYGVSFPIYSKVEVNGDGTIDLFKYLKESAPGVLGSKMIKWNFTKFLINKEGKVLERFAPKTKGAPLKNAIEAALNS